MTNPHRYEMKAVEEALEILLEGSPLDFQAGGQQISLGQRWLYFREYTGPSPKKSLGKPVVGPPDRPFAELQVVKRLEHQGWTAAWLYRQRKFIAKWEPREEIQSSRRAQALLAQIKARAGKNASSWDVFAWEPDLRFIHLVRGSSKTLPAAKLRWLEAALAEGLPCSTFEIWRWFGGALDGRVLRLTDYTLDRLDGWVEWQNGRLTYSDGKQQDDMVEHYRDWGAQTEADLLWLVFVRNSDGMTWCGFEERDAGLKEKGDGPELPL